MPSVLAESPSARNGMSPSGFGRVQKASAIVPLALLSAAWTASLAGVGVTTASAGSDPVQTLPDGTSVPTEAIEAPASVSQPGVVAAGISGNADDAVANASAMGIPAAALAAYQRAETVINSADKTCNISWQLIAAIGRVESDHGRVNGNSLNADGLATPGIYGIALDGTNNTANIPDSDAGLYDADDKYDRAVGPMQFIPSTWLVVGVDADGDAERNPQDIDDAALASAVYLCSGDDDLGTTAGQREAVYRYNHSQSYVDLVLSFMDAYLEGDFTSVPNGTTSAGYFVPSSSGNGPAADGSGEGVKGGGSNDGDSSGDATQPEETPEEETPEEETPIPVDPDGDGDGDGLPAPNLPTIPQPNPTPPQLPLPLSQVKAVAECLATGLDPLRNKATLDRCVNNLVNP